jgi:peptidyl-prolyl cis-trans isomerase B (cyclophilin B)
MKSALFACLLGLLLGAATACNNNQSKTADPTGSNQGTAANPEKGAIANPPANTVNPTNANPAPAPSTNEVAVIKTALGDMTIEFWPEAAPKTVENFKTLARKGFYDGTAFHRVMKGFMIQGGDPLSKKNSPEVGTGGPGYSIPAEFNDHPHVRGVISMARSSDPNSAGSQFFICLGPANFLDGQYTAFGHLVQGDDVLGKLGDTPVGPSPSGEASKPLSRVGVVSIKIVPAPAAK